jgi:hypothetical protein
MLPGEAVLYEAPGEVRYGRTSYRLYVTGERLLLYSVGGLFSPKERVVAEPLSDVGLLEYSEGGLFSARGRLDIKLPGNTLSLAGDAETIKGVLRALQGQTLRQPAAATDWDATLVVPPEPLFDDLPGPPRQVEPLPPARGAGASRTWRRHAAVAALCLVVLAAAATALFLNRRQPQPRAGAGAADGAAPSAPQPTPGAARPSVHILDETFALPEGSHRAVKFTIPGGETGARVAGGFRVTGGSYVDFYVMSEAQYDRFAAGAPADLTSAVYRREQWNARVGERLPPGAYYLVFDNREYGAGQQAVAAEFFVVFGEAAAAP